MFTGIVRETGRVEAAEARGNGRVLRIRAPQTAPTLSEGDSIAVDGVCQTVVSVDGGAFTVEAIATTLSRTTLGRLAVGDPVNLEPALGLGEALGGHLVQGHVDGVGEVTRVERQGEHVLLEVRVPPVVAEVTVLHGSIAIQGVSLTVNDRPGPDRVEVALIPMTWDRTTLSGLRPGDEVNLEGDMLGRFVVDYLKRTGGIGVWSNAASPELGSGDEQGRG